MRPIAMKCTQEQFDSIKDRIVYENIGNFNNCPYLTNDNFFSKSGITNGTEIYETFNANIFLQACDVEVEKVWKGREMQYRTIGNDLWCDIDSFEFRLKPQPNYQKEIEALQNAAKENGMKVIINFEKI